MDKRVWRTEVQGGYVRIFEHVDGQRKGNPISVGKRVFGDQIAAALNAAYAAGVADSRADHARETKTKLADLLLEMGHDKAADIVRQAIV